MLLLRLLDLLGYTVKIVMNCIRCDQDYALEKPISMVLLYCKGNRIVGECPHCEEYRKMSDVLWGGPEFADITVNVDA